jgi:capsular polysaccharide biosynthesis protein
MSEQNLDLRTSTRIVRRRKKLFSGLVALGLLAGAAYGYVTPPPVSSTALVVVAGNPQTILNPAAANPGTVDASIATQVVIAGSGPVLAAALPNVSPPIASVPALESKVSVAAVGTSDILSISATGKTVGQANNIANAVANSYVTYVTNSTNVAVHVVAKVVEPAAAAAPKLPEHLALYAVLGLLAGAILGFVVCLALGRGERRLVQRDDIANSIVVPVLASLPVEHPSDPPSWARLLAEYEPDAVHAYGLSRLLQQLGVTNYASDGTHANATSITVLSLASDPRALALGPQLAAFAAAHGIPTALVIGPQQDSNVTAALRTTCAAGTQLTAGRGKTLRVLAAEDVELSQVRAALTIVVMVIDGREPRIPGGPRTSTTVLGVSAGKVTAAELARAATAAAADGRDIYGILVANPDPSDQTTGRIPRLSPMRRVLPTRVNGLVTETRR